MTDKIFETPDADTTIIKGVQYADNKTASGRIVIHVDMPKTRIVVEMWENIDRADQLAIISGIASRFPNTQPVPNPFDK